MELLVILSVLILILVIWNIILEWRFSKFHANLNKIELSKNSIAREVRDIQRGVSLPIRNLPNVPYSNMQITHDFVPINKIISLILDHLGIDLEFKYAESMPVRFVKREKNNDKEGKNTK
jgi:hypothetical protein